MTIAAPLPENEPARLALLQALEVLDTPPDARFDSITKLASSIFSAPIALVSLVDEERQWFKSRCGLGATETSRETAFCAHAILSNDIFYIEDATKDERFKNNPLVTGAPHIRTYCGAPIIFGENLAVGTLCIIFDKVTVLNDSQKQQLKSLAEMVKTELVLNKSANDSLQMQVAHDEFKKELSQKAALKSGFYAALAHDLRSPLTSIIGFSQLLEFAPDQGPETVKHYAEIIKHGGQKLLGLVNEIMQAVELDADGFSIHPKKVSFSELYTNCIKPHLAQLDQKNIKADVSGWDEDHLCFADPQALSHVFGNLISNAFKFSPPGSTIKILAEKTMSGSQFTIWDSGPGFSDQGLKNFGEAYFTESLALSKNTIGTGLGTFCAVHYIKAHNGTISASNTDTGARIDIQLKS